MGFIQAMMILTGVLEEGITVDSLASNTRIAPLWDDIGVVNFEDFEDDDYDGEDFDTEELIDQGLGIFVDESAADRVTIRWSVLNFRDESRVEFAVTLFESGEIRFDYGPGNSNLEPVVGISSGTGAYELAPDHHGKPNLAGVPSVIFEPVLSVVDLGAFEFIGALPPIDPIIPIDIEIGEVQIISLVQGWNWISFTVLPEDRSVDNVLASYDPTDNDIIETFDGRAVYTDGDWNGDLEEIEYGRAYKLRVRDDSPSALTVSGRAMEPDVHVELEAGWNWVGFNIDALTPLDEALSHIELTDGDLVKTTEGIAMRDSGRWYGDLSHVRPGTGYMIRLTLNDENGGQDNAESPVQEGVKNYDAPAPATESSVKDTVSQPAYDRIIEETVRQNETDGETEDIEHPSAVPTPASHPQDDIHEIVPVSARPHAYRQNMSHSIDHSTLPVARVQDRARGLAEKVQHKLYSEARMPVIRIARIPACALDRQDACHTFRLQLFGHPPGGLFVVSYQNRENCILSFSANRRVGNHQYQHLLSVTSPADAGTYRRTFHQPLRENVAESGTLYADTSPLISFTGDESSEKEEDIRYAPAWEETETTVERFIAYPIDYTLKTFHVSEQVSSDKFNIYCGFVIIDSKTTEVEP